MSLLTGTTAGRDTTTELEPAIHELLTEDDPERAHLRWLESDVAALFNESVYYPYTSLRYHTLLVTALVHCYETGLTFEDLALAVDPPSETVPFRTIFASDAFNLRLTPHPHTDTHPTAHLGDQPARSWATVWSQLTDHPLDTDHDKWAMTLDANLRRIQSWSTALQYLEAFQSWRASQ